jgi:hypothetical protein
MDWSKVTLKRQRGSVLAFFGEAMLAECMMNPLEADNWILAADYTSDDESKDDSIRQRLAAMSSKLKGYG